MAIALVGAVLLHSVPRRVAPPSPPKSPGASPTIVPAAPAGPRSAERPGPAGRPVMPGQAGPVVPGLAARRACPQTATACVDLSDRITWLQRHGRIEFGPVKMEPGTGRQPTPVGTFHVAWKGGPHYISTSYRVPIPWPVFFATGGIAFHAGSLTVGSHGCVHLRMAIARYYHDHLPIGAEVVVFARPR